MDPFDEGIISSDSHTSNDEAGLPNSLVKKRKIEDLPRLRDLEIEKY